MLDFQLCRPPRASLDYARLARADRKASKGSSDDWHSITLDRLADRVLEAFCILANPNGLPSARRLPAISSAFFEKAFLCAGRLLLLKLCILQPRLKGRQRHRLLSTAAKTSSNFVGEDGQWPAQAASSGATVSPVDDHLTDNLAFNRDAATRPI